MFDVGLAASDLLDEQRRAEKEPIHGQVRWSTPSWSSKHPAEDSDSRSDGKTRDT